MTSISATREIREALFFVIEVLTCYRLSDKKPSPQTQLAEKKETTVISSAHNMHNSTTPNVLFITQESFKLQTTRLNPQQDFQIWALSSVW